MKIFTATCIPRVLVNDQPFIIGDSIIKDYSNENLQKFLNDKKYYKAVTSIRVNACSTSEAKHSITSKNSDLFILNISPYESD